QVWEQLSEPREFLAHLCAKAGLPRDAWRQPGIEISTYQVEKFNLVKTSEVSGKSFEDTS
ncbi:MAG: AMMECR1 domain-containing protein, partial [Anaerolineae bacterium]|nr:AMMECR1 domain-containing protein [Anaerolineae bacterium]